MRIPPLIGLVLALGGCGGEPYCPAPPDGKWPFSVALRVTDSSSGQPIGGTPSFWKHGGPISAVCYGKEKLDLAGTTAPCDSWSLDLLGTYQVTVSAQGFFPATVIVDNDLGPPCHYWGMVSKSVTLYRQ